jgi:hypothetical protein
MTMNNRDRIRFDFGDFIWQSFKWGLFFFFVILVLGAFSWYFLYWLLSSPNSFIR